MTKVNASIVWSLLLVLVGLCATEAAVIQEQKWKDTYDKVVVEDESIKDNLIDDDYNAIQGMYPPKKNAIFFEYKAYDVKPLSIDMAPPFEEVNAETTTTTVIDTTTEEEEEVREETTVTTTTMTQTEEAAVGNVTNVQTFESTDGAPTREPTVIEKVLTYMWEAVRKTFEFVGSIFGGNASGHEGVATATTAATSPASSTKLFALAEEDESSAKLRLPSEESDNRGRDIDSLLYGQGIA